MYLKDSKTVVIKIGSSLLIDKDKKIRGKWLNEFAKDIKNLKNLKKFKKLQLASEIIDCSDISLKKLFFKREQFSRLFIRFNLN